MSATSSCVQDADEGLARGEARGNLGAERLGLHRLDEGLHHRQRDVRLEQRHARCRAAPRAMFSSVMRPRPRRRLDGAAETRWSGCRTCGVRQLRSGACRRLITEYRHPGLPLEEHGLELPRPPSCRCLRCSCCSSSSPSPPAPRWRCSRSTAIASATARRPGSPRRGCSSGCCTSPTSGWAQTW